MPFEPVYEKIAVGRQTVRTEEKIKAECRTDIPTETVAKIINLTAQSVITEKTCSENGIAYSGKVTFFLCYEDTSGALCKCECGAEFSGKTDPPFDGEYRAYVYAETEKTEADASGVKLSVACYAAVKTDVYATEDKRALCRGDGIIVKDEEITVIKSAGLRETCYPVEDEIELNYKVAQVISQSARAQVTAVQCGVGSIITDGELFLCVVALQSGEKSGIIKEEKIIPFKIETECEEAMPSAKAVARASVKSLKTDIYVDENADSSKLVANVIIKCEGEAFFEENKSVAVDAFMPEYSAETEYESSFTVRKLDVTSEKITVSERISVDEIPSGAFVAAVCGEKAEVVSVEKTADGINASGTLSLNILFTDADGKIFSRKAEAPFERKIKTAEADEYVVSATAFKSQAKIVSASETEISADVCFSVYPEEKTYFKYITDARSVGDKEVNDHAISVYFALAGEDLWGLSKRLGVHPQTLLESNSDLQFPLSGEERIIVYRKK